MYCVGDKTCTMSSVRVSHTRSRRSSLDCSTCVDPEIHCTPVTRLRSTIREVNILPDEMSHVMSRWSLAPDTSIALSGLIVRAPILREWPLNACSDRASEAASHCKIVLSRLAVKNLPIFGAHTICGFYPGIKIWRICTNSRTDREMQTHLVDVTRVLLGKVLCDGPSFPIICRNNLQTPTSTSFVRLKLDNSSRKKFCDFSPSFFVLRFPLLPQAKWRNHPERRRTESAVAGQEEAPGVSLRQQAAKSSQHVLSLLQSCHCHSSSRSGYRFQARHLQLHSVQDSEIEADWHKFGGDRMNGARQDLEASMEIAGHFLLLLNIANETIAFQDSFPSIDAVCW